MYVATLVALQLVACACAQDAYNSFYYGKEESPEWDTDAYGLYGEDATQPAVKPSATTAENEIATIERPTTPESAAQGAKADETTVSLAESRPVSTDFQGQDVLTSKGYQELATTVKPGTTPGAGKELPPPTTTTASTTSTTSSDERTEKKPSLLAKLLPSTEPHAFEPESTDSPEVDETTMYEERYDVLDWGDADGAGNVNPFARPAPTDGVQTTQASGQDDAGVNWMIFAIILLVLLCILILSGIVIVIVRRGICRTCCQKLKAEQGCISMEKSHQSLTDEPFDGTNSEDSDSLVEVIIATTEAESGNVASGNNCSSKANSTAETSDRRAQANDQQPQAPDDVPQPAASDAPTVENEETENAAADDDHHDHDDEQRDDDTAHHRVDVYHGPHSLADAPPPQYAQVVRADSHQSAASPANVANALFGDETILESSKPPSSPTPPPPLVLPRPVRPAKPDCYRLPTKDAKQSDEGRKRSRDGEKDQDRPRMRRRKQRTASKDKDGGNATRKRDSTSKRKPTRERHRAAEKAAERKRSKAREEKKKKKGEAEGGNRRKEALLRQLLEDIREVEVLQEKLDRTRKWVHKQNSTDGKSERKSRRKSDRKRSSERPAPAASRGTSSDASVEQKKQRRRSALYRERINKPDAPNSARPRQRSRKTA